jgi:hypothetical protein
VTATPDDAPLPEKPAAGTPGVGHWRELPPDYDPFAPRGEATGGRGGGLSSGVRHGLPLWLTIALVALGMAAVGAVLIGVVGSALTGDKAVARDAAVEAGGRRIAFEIKAWPLGAMGGGYPAESEVAVDGAVGVALARDGLEWPTNPFTGEPMRQGTDAGDFTYQVASDGGDFTLTVYLSDDRHLVLSGDASD